MDYENFKESFTEALQEDLYGKGIEARFDTKSVEKLNNMEGYGNDNPGAKSQGMKQLMAGGGVALIGTTLVPLLSGLF